MTAREPLSPERLAEIREWRDELGAGKQAAAVGPYSAIRDLLAELERLRELTATCTCGTPGLDYDGPAVDCAVHGAVRALNLAHAEIEALKKQVADTERRVRGEIEDDFFQFGKRRDSLPYGEAILIVREGLCRCRGGGKACATEGGGEPS